MVRVDDTRVMVAQLPLAGEPPAASRAPAPIDVRDVDAAAFVAWLGAQRGSSAVEIAAHAARLRDSPVAYRALAAVDGEGRIVAGGQVAIEDDMAGLYDVATDPAWRRRGLCERICRELLQMAHRAGVVTAYLQVDAANAGARSVYARLGFADAYGYHYRSMPPS